MTRRVVQWATGPVGSVQLAEVIDNPDLELIGLFVYTSCVICLCAWTIPSAAAPVSVMRKPLRSARSPNGA
ncbi:hypothetical protein [Mycobacterium sp.]|uniref:hypothetical protein n=1 Tax=Mycobacterium sp. TaxID=1785 RepID=UPI003C796FF7